MDPLDGELSIGRDGYGNAARTWKNWLGDRGDGNLVQTVKVVPAGFFRPTMPELFMFAGTLLRGEDWHADKFNLRRRATDLAEALLASTNIDPLTAARLYLDREWPHARWTPHEEGRP